MEEAAPLPTPAEPIYFGHVPVVIKHPDREDRLTTLTVAMSYGVGQPRNQRILHVQLTDESDSFLLYNLDISEDEFHALKTEQSILVDFPTFPSKYIELLRQCQAAASEEHPRFVAQLMTGNGTPLFTVTETNPFRQLAHLCLRFVAGNDAAIKKYLAGRLAELKSELGKTQDELSVRSRQLQETAEHASAQVERVRKLTEEHTYSTSDLQVQCSNAIAETKEKAVAAQQEALRAAEAERLRLVERHEAEMASARTSEQAAGAEAARLKARGHDLELQLRERGNRLEALEQEASLLRKSNAELREENADLSSTKHKQEKSLGAKDVEIAALTQSVADKEELNAKTGSLLDAANEAKARQDESIALYKENNGKLQDKVKASSAEIAKGNQIIAKLQADSRALRSKLRLKAAVMLQQEEQAAQKQQEKEASVMENADLRAQIAEANAEKARADESATDARRQLTEAQELLRSNQQIIQCLNKELNDAQAGQHAKPQLSSRLAAFRPTLPPPGEAAGGAPASPPAMPSPDALPTGAGASGSAAGTPPAPPLASGAPPPAGSPYSVASKVSLPASKPLAMQSRAGLAALECSKAAGFGDYLAAA